MRRRNLPRLTNVFLPVMGTALLTVAVGCARTKPAPAPPAVVAVAPPAAEKPAAPPPEPLKKGEVLLFNGKDLAGWKIVNTADFARHGKVYAADGQLMLSQGDPMTGIQWAGDFPTDNYEVTLEAMRVTGDDFFCGMTFPVAKSYCTLIVGGWGGNVVGLSNVDGENASENQTTTGKSFDKDRWYRLRLRLTTAKIEVWIDQEQVIDLERGTHKFDVWLEQQPITPFGVATWNSGGALRNFRLRRIEAEGE